MSKIFIGTPCYGGMITADYFKSCLQLTAVAASKKVELQFGTIGNESLITRARNTLVQLFMDDEQYTHLLFIDADISFSPESVMRMIDLDEEIVTGVYPRKTIDWRKVKNKVLQNPEINEDELLASSLEYNLNVVNPDNKRYLSEDYAFCRLWQKIGGKVYADIASGLTHYGNYSFKGNVGTQFLPENNK